MQRVMVTFDGNLCIVKVIQRFLKFLASVRLLLLRLPNSEYQQMFHLHI